MRPRRSGLSRRVVTSSSDSTSARDRRLGGGDLGGRHLGEILLLQHLAVGNGEAGVELDLAPFLRAASRAAREQRLLRCAGARPAASAARPAAPAAAASPSACRDNRACERRCGRPDRRARCARAASRTPHAASSRNRRALPMPAASTAAQRIEHRARPDRHAGRAQRAREIEDVLGEPALARSPAGRASLRRPQFGAQPPRSAPWPWRLRCARCRPGI